jgi:hypothetical protein
MKRVIMMNKEVEDRSVFYTTKITRMITERIIESKIIHLQEFDL